jgi:hypothetical protein
LVVLNLACDATNSQPFAPKKSSAESTSMVESPPPRSTCMFSSQEPNFSRS